MTKFKYCWRGPFAWGGSGDAGLDSRDQIMSLNTSWPLRAYNLAAKMNQTFKWRDKLKKKKREMYELTAHDK